MREKNVVNLDYRRAFFHNFQSLEKIVRDIYVLVYGEVLSLLFVKLSRDKNIKFVDIPVYGGKKTGKYGKLQNCATKMS